jgi:hypothetical protein
MICLKVKDLNEASRKLILHFFRGRSRQGNPSPLIRRQLGAGIRDARQIINSHQRGKSRRVREVMPS